MGKVPLAKETAYFEHHVQEWLSIHLSEWVLIRGEELEGFFETHAEAYRVGVQKYGNTPFLVRQVTGDGSTVNIPVLSTGLLHARN